MLLVGPGVLAAVATYGRTFNPGAWWLIALLGAGAARLLTGRLDRPVERMFAQITAAAAIAWLAEAWQVGPYQLWLVVPVIVLAPVLTGLWALYGTFRAWPAIEWPRVRGRVREKGWWRLAGEFRRALALQLRANRRWGRMRRDWEWTSVFRGVGLPGSRLVSARWDRDGPRSLVLHLAEGRTADAAAQAAAALEVEWRLTKGSLRARPGPRGAHEVVLEVRPPAEMAALGHVILWPDDPPASPAEPIRLGEFTGGRPVLIPVLDPKSGKLAPHLQISGQTGYGKGSAVNAILAATGESWWWEHWGVDAKEGVELWPWRGLFRHLAISDQEATELLQRAIEEMRRRLIFLREVRQERFWTPRRGEPLLMLLVDEWGVLGPAAKDSLDVLLSQGRAAGIWCVLCTQRPSARKTGGTGETGDARSQLGLQISYYLRPGDETLAFGEDARREGWRSDRLTVPGRALIRWQGHYDDPDPFQTFWLDDEAVARAAARAVALRALWPRESDATVSAVERAPSVRSPSYAEVVVAAESGRPALHLVGPDPEDPLIRLRVALASAPPEGLRRAELIARTRMSDSWVDQRLRELRAAGEAVNVGRALWRGPGASPVRATQEA